MTERSGGMAIPSTSLLAGVRSPQEVLEIVLTPDQARKAVDKLRQALLCVPDTMLAVDDGELVWLWSDPANATGQGRRQPYPAPDCSVEGLA